MKTAARLLAQFSRRFLKLLAIDSFISTLFIVIFPPTPSENSYLRDIGIPEGTRHRLWRATARQGIGAELTLLSATAIYFFLISQVDSDFPEVVTRIAAAFSAGSAAMAGILLYSSLSPYTRLLVSVARCTRLLFILEDGVRHPFDHIVGKDVITHIYFRRRIAGVAWALTRDTALINGNQTSAGSTVGEILLWFADSPYDRRRRPILGAYLAELIAAVDNNTTIPEADFAPAARFRTRSPRDRLLRQLRAVAGGALTTGIAVAVISALLKFWFAN
jgi:hypothetical protein